jgi:hypothetical protein
MKDKDKITLVREFFDEAYMYACIIHGLPPFKPEERTESLNNLKRLAHDLLLELLGREPTAEEAHDSLREELEPPLRRSRDPDSSGPSTLLELF